MKKTVLTYGLISGVIAAVLMLVPRRTADDADFGRHSSSKMTPIRESAFL